MYLGITKTIGIFLVIERMGWISNTLDNHRCIQATIYLLQALGIDLRFCFEYLEGLRSREPYSKGLYDDIITCMEYTQHHNTRCFEGSKLLFPVAKIVDSIAATIDTKPNSLSSADWLMLLCMVYSVKDEAFPGESIGLGNARVLIQNPRNTNQHTAENVDRAWNQLKTLGVFNRKRTCN